MNDTETDEAVQRVVRFFEGMSPQSLPRLGEIYTEDADFKDPFNQVRGLARIEGKTVRLFTRNGHDWSERMPHLVRAIQRMKRKTSRALASPRSQRQRM